MAPTYGLTAAVDGVVAGKTYRLKSRSTNAVGASEYSLEAFIAFGPVPGAPGQPQRVSSTRTSLTLSWTAPTSSAGDLPILGYVLNMDDGLTKHLAPVYVGNGLPGILQYTVGGLTTGLPYLLSAQAIDQNGYSSHSPMASYYACIAPPSIARPVYVSSDWSTKAITVQWERPADNGGCAILGYRLYRTAGSSDQFDQTDPSTLVAALVGADPSVIQHTIDLTAGTVGLYYRFKIQLYNEAGQRDSNSLTLALASLPSKPPVKPYSDATVTGPDALGLQIDPLGTTALTGGSSILQYELQYDDGLRGPYKSVYTLDPLITVTQGV